MSYPPQGAPAGVTKHSELTDVSTPHVLADLEEAVCSETELADHAGLPSVHHTKTTPYTHPTTGTCPQAPKAHTLASHSTKAHTELTGVTANQHHTKYTNAEVPAAVIAGIVGGAEIRASTNPNVQERGAPSYGKLKEIRLDAKPPPTIRIKFAMRGYDQTVYGKIYRNDIAIGVERSAGTTYTTFSEDFNSSGWAINDRIQLYARILAWDGYLRKVFVKDLDLYYGITIPTTNQDP